MTWPSWCAVLYWYFFWIASAGPHGWMNILHIVSPAKTSEIGLSINTIHFQWKCDSRIVWWNDVNHNNVGLDNCDVKSPHVCWLWPYGLCAGQLMRIFTAVSEEKPLMGCSWVSGINSFVVTEWWREGEREGRAADGGGTEGWWAASLTAASPLRRAAPVSSHREPAGTPPAPLH